MKPCRCGFVFSSGFNVDCDCASCGVESERHLSQHNAKYVQSGVCIAVDAESPNEQCSRPTMYKNGYCFKHKQLAEEAARQTGLARAARNEANYAALPKYLRNSNTGGTPHDKRALIGTDQLSSSLSRMRPAANHSLSNPRTRARQ